VDIFDVCGLVKHSCQFSEITETSSGRVYQLIGSEDMSLEEFQQCTLNNRCMCVRVWKQDLNPHVIFVSLRVPKLEPVKNLWALAKKWLSWKRRTSPVSQFFVKKFYVYILSS
jgi:hypothetical protein